MKTKWVKFLVTGLFLFVTGFGISTKIVTENSSIDVKLSSLEKALADPECNRFWDYDNGGCPLGSQLCCQ